MLEIEVLCRMHHGEGWTWLKVGIGPVRVDWFSEFGHWFIYLYCKPWWCRFSSAGWLAGKGA